MVGGRLASTIESGGARVAQTDTFYADLEPVGSFAEVARFEDYQPVPDDWVVLIGDIQGSTQAIRDGNYKTVNMVGAAVITCVLNVCEDVPVPFVFGGDGGTLVVPGRLAEAARQALGQLQAVSEAWFGLTLRAGAIPVGALRVGGHDVRVLKLRLSAGNDLAMFSGGGLDYCDDWLKRAQSGDPILVESGDLDVEGGPPLEGLSCRWHPLPAGRGVIATTLVAGIDTSEYGQRQLFHRVTQGLANIIGGELAAASPVNDDSLRFRWPPAGLSLEAQATAGGKPLWRRKGEILLQSLIQYGCERFRAKVGYYDAPRYRQELMTNCDFQKYDGLLRLVLDVTPEQAKMIEAFLREENASGQLYYGMHTSRDALMTCVVFSLQHSRHMHFIDGGDGGYAMAAVGLKLQRSAAQSSQTGFGI